MSVNSPNDYSIILFAKAPVPGTVKTRLCPPLTHDEAAQVATNLLLESLQLVVENWAGRVVLAVTPDADHEVFKQLAEKYNTGAANDEGKSQKIEFILQRGEGLGERMLNALNDVGYPAAVMGCDIPHCPPNIIKAAYAGLHGRRDYIGPTEDGGYYLLGLSEPRKYLFEGMAWGTESVLSNTLEKAEQNSLQLMQLPQLRDIDEYDDLIAVVDQFESLSFVRDKL